VSERGDESAERRKLHCVARVFERVRDTSSHRQGRAHVLRSCTTLAATRPKTSPSAPLQRQCDRSIKQRTKHHCAPKYCALLNIVPCCFHLDASLPSVLARLNDALTHYTENFFVFHYA